jgi:hypothetical protein
MNEPAKKKAFDFNEWSNLATTDPHAFEKRREMAIEKVISTMSDAKQERIRRLQWRIDQERSLCKTPMAACIKLSHMMWDNVLGKNGLLDNLRYVDMSKAGRQQIHNTDNVVNFPNLQK